MTAWKSVPSLDLHAYVLNLSTSPASEERPRSVYLKSRDPAHRVVPFFRGRRSKLRGRTCLLSKGRLHKDLSFVSHLKYLWKVLWIITRKTCSTLENWLRRKALNNDHTSTYSVTLTAFRLFTTARACFPYGGHWFLSDCTTWRWRTKWRILLRWKSGLSNLGDKPLRLCESTSFLGLFATGQAFAKDHISHQTANDMFSWQRVSDRCLKTKKPSTWGVLIFELIKTLSKSRHCISKFTDTKVRQPSLHSCLSDSRTPRLKFSRTDSHKNR